MAKDPAVLFYFQDFLVGTVFMTDDEVGKYIRILCHQADKGRLSEKQVLSICKADVIPNVIKEKLKVDSDGLYYNARMQSEKEKRSKFTESRRNNALGIKAHAKHMEDEDRDINKDGDIDIYNDDESVTDSTQMQLLWMRTFGRNPKIPEVEISEKFIQKFGIEKTRKIFKEAVLENFHNVKKLWESLNEDGSIKPKQGNSGNGKKTGVYGQYLTEDKLRGIAEDIANDPRLT